MTKKERLKVAFKVLIMDLLNKLAFDTNVNVDVVHESVNDTANSMIKEVSIRTPLR